MAEGRDLVQEAIQDAKSLKQAAVESAKNQLVESLAPAVRELLNRSIKGVLKETASPAQHVNGVHQGKNGPDRAEQRAQNADPNHPENVEEGASADLTLEDALQEFFPKQGEEQKMDIKESAKSSGKKSSIKEEVASSGKSSAASMHEEVEISEQELKKVYEAALQTEVNVSKGFKDIAKPEELDQAHKNKGIQQSGGGEKHWEKQSVPAKKDWIPENVQKMLHAGLEENKALRESLRKAVAMVETLGKKLHEVNLFNAKVLHVNKILNNGVKLTKEQKTYVMESIDKAHSIGEVKMVYETILGAIKTTTTALTEGKNVRPPKADAQKARTSGTPDQKVLSESVDRSTDGAFSRMQQLAGIVNGKK